jgi:nicotinate-nucleotide pyrophosphorylase (carboxylating)
MTDLNALNFIGSSLAFTIDPDRLVGLFYENFWPTLPVTLPLQYFRQRILTHRQDLELLLLVVQFVGSVYAPWTPSDPYHQIALQAVSQTNLPKTGFTVQALLIFAVAEIHLDLKCETRKPLDDAVSLGLELQLNKKEFAYQHGEGNPVLEESWRRTYYLLHVTEQHAAVVANSPFFALRDVPNLVDLPCDDEYYQSGV